MGTELAMETQETRNPQKIDLRIQTNTSRVMTNDPKVATLLLRIARAMDPWRTVTMKMELSPLRSGKLEKTNQKFHDCWLVPSSRIILCATKAAINTFSRRSTG